ncbi:RRM domain-containing protein [Meloidogyne graminicola]|uniref:RNA-binding protein 42 n=1 Tax=Meloidogyne graminicola TaxID=189291 RepID=A0A8S9ZVG2_9BILA|nr:RRM domain-containing protein [Meloidogyne graminicola]
MSSLDEQLALFEKEVLLSSNEAISNSSFASTKGQKQDAPIQAPDVGGSHPTTAVKFVPHQVTRIILQRVSFSSGRVAFPPHLQAPPVPTVIESGPTLYANAARSASSQTSAEPSSVPTPISYNSAQQQNFKTLALPSDVELLLARKQATKAHENSYLGAVLRGEKKMKRFVRCCGGQVWEDPSMAEWDPNDYRIFCGDLGNEVSDELLAKAFRKFPSFQKAKVCRDSRTNKSKGFGFVSFKNQEDFIRAMKEMDGKYVGNRPIKLRKSNWKDRNLDIVKKKTKEKKKLGLL